MKPINEYTLQECLNEIRSFTQRYENCVLAKYDEPTQELDELSNRIDKLLYEQAQQNDAYVDALENKISALEEKHRWIPVGERLPTIDDTLGWGEYMGIEFWSNKFGGMKLFCTVARFNQDFIESNEVTHWRRIDTPEGV